MSDLEIGFIIIGLGIIWLLLTILVVLFDFSKFENYWKNRR